MRRTLFAFLFGLVTGIALIHILEGPLDFRLLRTEASQALDEAGRTARDLRLTGAVRAALALQRDFRLFGGIRVESQEGVVRLSGEVASEDQRQLAELITRGVDGVEEVVNDLDVVPREESEEQG